MSTIDYYNQHAQAFYDRSIDIDRTESYQAFLSLLPGKARILDAGCGSGRDTKYFLNLGHEVVSFDASEEMVRLSTDTCGQQTLHLRFQDMDFTNHFDGVWASASLLHVPYTDTSAVLSKIHRALKPHGLFYASYKEGEGHMSIEGRDFYNMSRETIQPYLKDLFDVIEIGENADTRSRVVTSPSRMWLTILCRKK